MSDHPSLQPPPPPGFRQGWLNDILRVFELAPGWLYGLVAVGAAAVLAFVLVSAFDSSDAGVDGRSGAAVVTPSGAGSRSQVATPAGGSSAAGPPPATATPDAEDDGLSRALIPTQREIVDTDGLGVRWRSECNDDAPSLTEDGLPEGISVIVGRAGIGLCDGWLQVRPVTPAADDPEGPVWVREEFISGDPVAPPSPTASPTPSPSPTTSATPSATATPTSTPTTTATPDDDDLASEAAAAALAVQANALASLEAALVAAHALVFEAGTLPPGPGATRAFEIESSAASVGRALRAPSIVPDGADSDCEDARDELLAAAAALEEYASLEAALFAQGTPGGSLGALVGSAAAQYRAAFSRYGAEAEGCAQA